MIFLGTRLEVTSFEACFSVKVTFLSNARNSICRTPRPAVRRSWNWHSRRPKRRFTSKLTFCDLLLSRPIAWTGSLSFRCQHYAAPGFERALNRIAIAKNRNQYAPLAPLTMSVQTGLLGRCEAEVRLGGGGAQRGLFRGVMLPTLQFPALFLVVPKRETLLAGGMGFLPIRTRLISGKVLFGRKRRISVGQTRVGVGKARSRIGIAGSSRRHFFEGSDGFPVRSERRSSFRELDQALSRADVAEADVGF